MKRWSTTPTKLKQLTTKSIIVAGAVMMVLAAPMQTASADSYDDRISEIQAQVSSFNAQAAELSKQADTLQNALNTITIEKNAIQAQLDLSQAKYDKLVIDIDTNEKKLASQQKVMATAIGDLASESTTSPIELLAGSTNIGDYIDQQEYSSSIRDQLNSSIVQVKKLKAELNKQKVDVERVLADQKVQRDSLAAKEAEQASLVAQTRNEEAAYQNLAVAKNSEIQALRAQQAASYRRYGSGANSPTGLAISYKNMVVQNCSSSGYSYCGYGWDDIVDDPWGLGYTKECVHYVADALTNRGYYIPYKLFSGRGNANQWASTVSGVARVDSTPAVDAVVYMPIGGVGHVGMVEEVYGNGYIRVSQMNLPFGGNYSTMDLQVTSNLTFMHFSR